MVIVILLWPVTPGATSACQETRSSLGHSSSRLDRPLAHVANQNALGATRLIRHAYTLDLVSYVAIGSASMRRTLTKQPRRALQKVTILTELPNHTHSSRISQGISKLPETAWRSVVQLRTAFQGRFPRCPRRALPYGTTLLRLAMRLRRSSYFRNVPNLGPIVSSPVQRHKPSYLCPECSSSISSSGRSVRPSDVKR